VRICMYLLQLCTRHARHLGCSRRVIEPVGQNTSNDPVPHLPPNGATWGQTMYREARAILVCPCDRTPRPQVNVCGKGRESPA
jgi:hypothetical protein